MTEADLSIETTISGSGFNETFTSTGMLVQPSVSVLKLTENPNEIIPRGAINFEFTCTTQGQTFTSAFETNILPEDHTAENVLNGHTLTLPGNANANNVFDRHP